MLGMAQGAPMQHLSNFVETCNWASALRASEVFLYRCLAHAQTRVSCCMLHEVSITLHSLGMCQGHLKTLKV